MHSPASWLSLKSAAEFLGVPLATLRKKIEREATLKNGVVEACFEGVRARKLAGRWKVHLGTWAAEVPRER